MKKKIGSCFWTTMYLDPIKEFNDKDPKSKAFYHARISKYKCIFAKGYIPNWSEEVFCDYSS